MKIQVVLLLVWFLGGLIVGTLVTQYPSGAFGDQVIVVAGLVGIVVLGVFFLSRLGQRWVDARSSPLTNPESLFPEPMFTPSRWNRLEALGLGLVLAIAGQFFFSFMRDRLIVGVAAYVASLAVFAGLVRVVRRKQLPDQIEAQAMQLQNPSRERVWVQGVVWLIAVLTILASVVVTQIPNDENDYWPAFYFWLIGVGVLGIGFVLLPLRSQVRPLVRRLAAARSEVLIVIGLTALALFLRVVDLMNIPYPWAGDEASIGLEAQHILDGNMTNMFVTGWQSEPSMSFLPWALSMVVFGENIFALRFLAAVIGTLTIPVLYVLTRSLFDKSMAMLSAFLLALMSVHIHFSRIAVNNVANAFFACLVFWLIYQAIKTRESYWFAAAGIAAGLSIYTFVGSRLVAILAGVFLLLGFITDRTWWREWKKFFLFGVTALLVVLPLAIFFWQHVDDAFGRVNQMGMFQSGWLDREASSVGQPRRVLVAEQAARSILIFVSDPATHGFYNSPGPLFDPLWSVFLILGIGFSIFSLRERRHIFLQLWFWPVVVFGGAILIPPPFAERYVMAFPVIAIFVAWGIRSVVSLFAHSMNAQPRVLPAMPFIFGVIFAITSLGFYFFEYTPKHYYTDPNSEVGMELGNYLATVPRDTMVYFLGEPRMFYDAPSLQFLSKDLPGLNFPIGADAKQIVQPHRRALFVALPDRQPEFDHIRQLYPGGTFIQVQRKTKPEEILYLAYTVQP